jgi:hypothetical protein
MHVIKQIAFCMVIASIYACTIGDKPMPFRDLEQDDFAKMNIVNVRTYGAMGDGVTDDRDAINTAHTAATVSGGILFFPAGTYRVSSALTTNSNVTLWFANGGKLSIDNGVTVTINGQIDAGLYQIFSGDGDVFFGPASVLEIYPQWWGAVADGSTDDTSAIQSALDVALASDLPLRFPAGNYKVATSALTVASTTGNHPRVKGDGPNATQIVQTTADVNLFEIGDSSADINGWSVTDMSLATVEGTGFCVVLTRMHRGYMTNIEIPGGGKSGAGGGIKLDSSLCNIFVAVNVSDNLPDLFAGRANLSGAYCWYLDDAASTIDSNDNAWISCVTEGGAYGLFTTSQAAHGCCYLGGTIEGQTTWMVYLDACHYWTIRGVWIEQGSGTPGGIYATGCRNGIFAPCLLAMGSVGNTAVELSNCELIRIEDASVQGKVLIDSDCSACSVDNVRLEGTNTLENDSISTRLGYITHTVYPNRTWGVRTRVHRIDNNCGDFETWTTGGVPQGWANYNTATLTKCGVGMADTERYSGNYCCKITKNSESTWEGIYFHVPDAFQDCWITVEGFIKTVQGRPMVTDSVGTGLYISSTLNKWVPFSFSFLKSAGAGLSLYILAGYDASDDECYVDGIKIWAEFNPYGSLLPMRGVTPDPYNPGGPNKFAIAQESAADVTNFKHTWGTGEEGLYDGQTITIIAGDDNSTIKDGASVNLAGNTDFAMGADDVITLMYYQGDWNEVSRSNN